MSTRVTTGARRVGFSSRIGMTMGASAVGAGPQVGRLGALGSAADGKGETMPQSPDWKRYLEAGMQFTELRRSQARAVAGDLVNHGQLARDQVSGAVDEIVAMSRRRSDALTGIVRARGLAAAVVVGPRDAGRSPTPRTQAELDGQEDRRSGREESDEDHRRQEGRGEEGGLTATVRRRLDAELVRRGLATSRAGRGRGGDAGPRARRPARPRRVRRARSRADEPIVAVGTRRAVRVPRRPQARRPRSPRSRSTRRTVGASTSAHPPAASPTACCNTAPATCSRSTSGAASSHGRCATTRASP